MHIIETDEIPLCVLMNTEGWDVLKSLSGITEIWCAREQHSQVSHSDQLKKDTAEL